MIIVTITLLIIIKLVGSEAEGFGRSRVDGLAPDIWNRRTAFTGSKANFERRENDQDFTSLQLIRWLLS